MSRRDWLAQATASCGLVRLGNLSLPCDGGRSGIRVSRSFSSCMLSEVSEYSERSERSVHSEQELQYGGLRLARCPARPRYWRRPRHSSETCDFMTSLSGSLSPTVRPLHHIDPWDYSMAHPGRVFIGLVRRFAVIPIDLSPRSDPSDPHWNRRAPR